MLSGVGAKRQNRKQKGGRSRLCCLKKLLD
jgi:hypothetical protein